MKQMNLQIQGLHTKWFADNRNTMSHQGIHKHDGNGCGDPGNTAFPAENKRLKKLNDLYNANQTLQLPEEKTIIALFILNAL